MTSCLAFANSAVAASSAITAVCESSAQKMRPSGRWRPALAITGIWQTTQKLVNWRQVSQIVGYALLEGTAFLGIIAYLVEDHVLALAVTGFCLLLMITTFPTRDRLNQWLDQQMDQLRELRSNRTA